MVQVVHPDNRYDDWEEMTTHAETVLQKLGLPYWVMLVCTGDMGFGTAKHTTWEFGCPRRTPTARSAPSAIAKPSSPAIYRPASRMRKAGTKFLHTLDGSGLAVGRTLVAILENHLQPTAVY